MDPGERLARGVESFLRSAPHTMELDPTLADILALNSGGVPFNFAPVASASLPPVPKAGADFRKPERRRSTRAPKAAESKRSKAAKRSKATASKRPQNELMVAERRIIDKFGEDVLALGRDDFKPHRERHALTAAENRALRSVRRRILGRTYAQRSRTKGAAAYETLKSECTRLRAENDAIRARMTWLSTQMQM